VDIEQQQEEAKLISGEPTYTTGVAARLLGVSTWYVNTRIASGELPAHRDERGWRLIPQDAVHALLEERRRATRELRTRVEALQRELEQERRRGNELAEQVKALWQL